MKLHAVCLQTRNSEKMVDFYEKLFGYAPTVDGGVDFRFLEHQLIVFKLYDADSLPTKSAALIYAVEDVDTEYRRLADLGIANAPPTDKPWGARSFIISDPDGNTISFFNDLA